VINYRAGIDGAGENVEKNNILGINMKRSVLTIFALLGVLLSGCAMKYPQTAAEFRRDIPKSSFGEVESYTVKRSFNKISATFKKQAHKCLSKRITSTSSGYMHYQVIVTAYKPTLRLGKNKLELHLQQHHESGVLNIQKMPKGGYYYLVADASRVNARKTKIDLYYPSMGSDVIIKAIKDWVTGKNVGCPDMTKM